MAVYTIDITKLKDIESKIKSEQESFEKVNSNYAASYVKTCSHTTINNMAKKLDDLFSKISTSYTNILSWYNDYISNAEGVENALAESGFSSISNGAISAEASKMSELETVDLNITGTFTAVVEMDDVSIDPSKLDPESLAVYEDTLAQLTALGFTKSEVDQVLLGYKTLEEIEQEILKNDERRQKYYELLALSPYGYSSITELDQNIATLQATLSTLENKYLAASEGDILAAFLYKLELPLSGFVADDEDAVWSYRNKNGELCFSGTNPVSTQGAGVSEVQGYSYNDLCLLFPESALLQEMKTVFGDTSNGILGLGATKSGFSWSKGKDNKDYLNRVDAYQKSLQGQKEELATQIASTKQQLDELNAIKVEVTEQLDYALNSIQNYTYNDDFTLFCGFSFNDKQNLDAFFEQVKEKTNTVMTSEYYEANYRPASEEDLATILFAYFNGYGNVTFNGYEMQINNTRVLSNDLMFENYGEWASALSETEKNVYNYIYKTEGAKAAYEWLDRIDTEVDERYIKGNLNYTLTEEQLAKFDEIYQASGVDEACKYAESISPDVVVGKTVKDQLWANESTLNQILASVGSVVITPFEGMGAMFNNANALLTGQEIYYSDIYSKGNVYRGSVSEYIREHGNGFWSFMYDTGMSIADSAAMIGLNAATGGTLSWALAPTMMGSRVYVSAVNDGKDRGLSDLESVLWGLSSAAVESLAEHWSLGKLTGLSQQADKILPKIVGKFSTFSNNPTINKVATRFFTAAYTSLRQGFSEGSEEAVTEIMNGFVDFFLIGKDKSNIMLTINAYEENGSTPEEAIKLALKDFGSDVFMAWLGGFVSGEVYGAPQGIKASSNYSKYVVSSKIAQAIVNDYNANAPANLQINSYTDYVERQVAMQIELESALSEFQERFAQAESITGKVMNALKGVKDSIMHAEQVEYLDAQTDSKAGQIRRATDILTGNLSAIVEAQSFTDIINILNQSVIEGGPEAITQKLNNLTEIFTEGTDMAAGPFRAFFEMFREHGLQHTIKVMQYAVEFGKYIKAPLNFSEIIYGALFHDTGMRGGISMEINKDGTISFKLVESYTLADISSKDMDNFLMGYVGKSFSTETTNADVDAYINDIVSKELGRPATVEDIDKYIFDHFQIKDWNTLNEKKKNLEVYAKKIRASKIDSVMEAEFGIKDWSSSHDLNLLPQEVLDAMLSDKLAGHARKNHPLNSALTILRESLTPDGVNKYVVAVLAMSHSKSTSGISDFSDVSQWKVCVDRLSQAMKASGFDQSEIDALNNVMNNLLDDPTQFNRLQMEAMAVRDGDAMSKLALNKDGKTISQSGGYFDVSWTPLASYEDVPTTFVEEVANITDVMYNEDGTPKLDANGRERIVRNEFSKKVHAGELNTEFASKSDGRSYRAEATILDPKSVPYSSLEAIYERIGEVATYGNCAFRKFVINLPAEMQGTPLAKWYEAQLKSFIDGKAGSKDLSAAAAKFYSSNNIFIKYV